MNIYFYLIYVYGYSLWYLLFGVFFICCKLIVFLCYCIFVFYILFVVDCGFEFDLLFIVEFMVLLINDYVYILKEYVCFNS